MTNRCIRPVMAALCGLALVCPAVGFAAIPTSAEVDRLQDEFEPRMQVSPLPLSGEVAVTPSAVIGYTFVLDGVDMRGTVGMPDVAAGVFGPLVGKTVDMQQVQAAIVKLNQAYRVRGHVLARAYLPPQDLPRAGAVLVVEVAEGKLGEVYAQGDVAKGYVNPLLARLVSATSPEAPGRQEAAGAAMERALLRLNDLPGTTAVGQLVPGRVSGTSDLVVKLKEEPLTLAGGLNNNGSRYLGPNQVQADVTLNNPLLGKLGWADELGLRLVQTPRLRELSYGEIRYGTPLNTWGTSVELRGNMAVSRPGWTLEGIDAESDVVGFGGELRQNLWRGQMLSNDVYVGFDWQDAETASMGLKLTEDRLREVTLGTRFWGTDAALGTYQYQLQMVHGLDAWDASGRRELGTSRYRGTGQGYTKVELAAERLQPLNENWALFLSGAGQFSSHALLAGSEFALGGQQFGRGYDPSELVGDHGVGGRAELQLTFRPEFAWLPYYQLFGFYDGGAVWNKDRSSTDKPVETLFSNGFGLRLPIWSVLDFELVLAKPATRKLASTGEDNPQVYFRLGGTFSP